MDEDKIIKEIIDLKDGVRLIREQMLTKDDGRKMIDMLEGLTGLVKKVSEDHAATIMWLTRLQDKVDKQEEEISRIKLQLKLA
jgi:uncharacterized protein YkvS